MRHLIAGLTLLAVTACGAPATEPPSPTETRTVEHARGATDIAGTPERVVVLDTGELDAVVALGVVPVGAVTAFDGGGLQSYLTDRLRDTRVVGTIESPDLEAIAALRPDLILSNEVRHADIYDQLSAIAPTVYAERVGVAWKDTLRLAGDALDRRAEADRLLADHEARAAEVGRAFGDPAATRVSMVRFTGGTIRLYDQGSFIGTILSDAGFARPESQKGQETFAEISPEQVSMADGDILFYAGYGDDGAADQAAVVGGPLWTALPVVAAGNAHEVSDDLWYLGIGPIAGGLVLDELATYAP
jgi:iron complex transport system substrate-binding protein